MSEKFDAELARTFGIGERLAAAKAALKTKKWEPNEEGETATISKALNPPSLGPKPTSVATKRKWDWSWVYKMLVRLALGILILFALYRIRRLLGARRQNCDQSDQQVFGAGPLAVSRETWVEHLREVAERIHGDRSVMRVAVDSVRVDVLLGLASQGNVTLSGVHAVPKAAVDAAHAAYTRAQSTSSTQDDLAELRLRVDSALRALERALPYSELKRTLGYLMESGGAFERSHESVSKQDVPRVHAVHQLRLALAPAGANFGKPQVQKCCLFIADVACTGKCKTKWLCEKHQKALATNFPGKSDLESLEAHLNHALSSDTVADSVRDKASELMGMLAWTDAAIHDLVVAGTNSDDLKFGAQPQSLLGGVMKASLEAGFSVAKGVAALGSGTVSALGQAVYAAGSALSGQDGASVLKAEPAPATESSAPATESSAPATESIAPAIAPATESNASATKYTPEQLAASSRIARAFRRSREKRAAKKASVPSTPASSASTDTSSAPVEPEVARSAKVSSQKGRAEPAADLARAKTKPDERKGRSEVSSERQAADARRRAWSAERKGRRDALFLSGRDFLERALVFVADDKKQEVQAKFDDRARKRARLLQELRKKAKFVDQLAFFLENVPLSDKHRAEQSAIAEYWAGKIVALEDTKFARYAMIRRNLETVRRDLLSVTIPLTVAQVRVLIERDASAIRRVVPADKREEIDELSAKCVLAVHSAPIPGPDATSDPIKTAYEAMVARGRQLYKGISWDEWAKRSLTPWTTRFVMYETANPSCTPSAPVKEMLLVGFYSLVERVKAVIKLPSIAASVTTPSSEGAAFGNILPAGLTLEKMANSALGRQIRSKLGGRADSLLGAATTGGSVITFISAVVAAAKVGEALIMKLLAFVVEGLKLLIKAILGHGHSKSDRLQTWLDSATQSPESRDAERKKLEAQEQLDVKTLQDKLQTLTNHKGTLEEALKKIDEMRNPKGTAFGMEADMAPARAGIVSGDKVHIIKGDSELMEIREKNTSQVQRSLKNAGTAAVSLLEGAKKVPGHIFGGMYETIGDVWEKGDVLELFGVLSAKIQESMFGTLSGDNRKWSARVATFLTVAFVEYDQYVRRVGEWCESPTSFRGLLTDPASVLEGDANKAYRDALREYGAVSVYAVMFLFGLRAAQILKTLFANSPLYRIVCNLLSRVKASLDNVPLVGRLLGSVVGGIASASGCNTAAGKSGGTGKAHADAKKELEQQIAKMTQGIEDVSAKIKKSARETTDEKPVPPTISTSDSADDAPQNVKILAAPAGAEANAEETGRAETLAIVGGVVDALLDNVVVAATPEPVLTEKQGSESPDGSPGIRQPTDLDSVDKKGAGEKPSETGDTGAMITFDGIDAMSEEERMQKDAELAAQGVNAFGRRYRHRR